MANAGTDINTSSLPIASSLILVTLFFSYWQKLKLEKDTIFAVARAVVQLIAVGFLLEYIFGLDSPLFTALMLLVMMTVAALNAAKRGRAIPNVRAISFVAILLGAALTLAVLVASRALHFVPAQVIPVGGMVISNAMIAIGLCYRAPISNFTSRRGEVEARIALGATSKMAALPIIRDSLKIGMVPTIDSAKTLGIVSLPGMMTDLITIQTDPMLFIPLFLDRNVAKNTAPQNPKNAATLRFFHLAVAVLGLIAFTISVYVVGSETNPKHGCAASSSPHSPAQWAHYQPRFSSASRPRSEGSIRSYLAQRPQSFHCLEQKDTITESSKLLIRGQSALPSLG